MRTYQGLLLTFAKEQKRGLVAQKGLSLRHRCSWIQMPIPIASFPGFVEHSRTSLYFYFLTFNTGVIITSSRWGFRRPDKTPLLPLRLSELRNKTRRQTGKDHNLPFKTDKARPEDVAEVPMFTPTQ